MFCSKIGAKNSPKCPKRLVWENIAATTNQADLLDHISKIHRLFQQGQKNGRQQGQELRWLSQFYTRNQNLLNYEQSWLICTFRNICEEASIRTLPPNLHLGDNDHPKNLPPVSLSLPKLEPYIGEDDDPDIKDTALIAHVILHTVSHKLDMDYQPKKRPKVVMQLVRFLDKIFYFVGIQLTDDFSQISMMDPSAVFFVYLAKKRARILLEREAEKIAQKAVKQAAKKAAKKASTLH
jgi:hypothetical protein